MPQQTDALTHFLHWFLAQPVTSWAPTAVYDYGLVRSLVLYRDAPYQVELFTVRPGGEFPEEHRHPACDTYEVGLYGEIPLTVNGQPATYTLLPLADGQLIPVCRIRPEDWHGAAAIPEGGAFLSVQQWLHGVEPTSIGLNWEGAAVSPEHVERFTEHAARPLRRVSRRPSPSREVVRQAQRALQHRGCFGGFAAGIITPSWRQALGAYQQHTGLPVTGELDPATLAALGVDALGDLIA